MAAVRKYSSTLGFIAKLANRYGLIFNKLLFMSKAVSSVLPVTSCTRPRFAVAQCGRILVEMLPFCEYNDLSWIFCEA
jgi:hypothetical protein